MSGSDSSEYDVLVLGGGSAGYAAARAAGQAGARVGLVERGPVGGLCILDGCIPSKALIRSAEALHRARTGRVLGAGARDVEPDYPAIQRRTRRIVDDFAASRRHAIANARCVELLYGLARFDGRHEVVVRRTGEDGTAAPDGTERRLVARKIVVATGSRPTIPPIPGLLEVGYLTSDDALWLDAPPASMVVIGAGLIALELGQFFARVGTRVTLLEREARLLGSEDPEVGETLARTLAGEGITIRTDATVTRCRRQEDGTRVVEAEIAGKRSRMTCEAILVALGRHAALDTLELHKAGVRVGEDGFVIVNAAMRTTNPDVFAAGDVTTPRQMTHLAVLQGEVAGENAARDLDLRPRRASRRMDYSVVPQVIFTDPPFARVGLSEREVREAGMAHEVSRVSYRDVAMAELLGETAGFAKLLAAPRGGKLLGVQILGRQADTLIHEAAAAMTLGATAAQLARVQHVHPTLSEVVLQAAEALLPPPGADRRA